MIRSSIKKWMAVFIISSTPFITHAAVPVWQIVPSESSITFTGTQNDAPATGSFKKFTGEISLDPKQLNASKVRIVIDMNSVSMSYSDFTNTLLTTDWLNVKLF